MGSTPMRSTPIGRKDIMTTFYSLQDVNNQLDAIIKDRGDFVYRQHYQHCQYGDGQQPMCIVGVLLHNNGIPLAGLQIMNEYGSVQQLFDQQALPDYPWEAIELLQRVQAWQDNTMAPWSDCVRLAREGFDPLIGSGAATVKARGWQLP